MADVPARVRDLIQRMPDDQLEVLRELGLRPEDVKARTLLAVAQRYGLDPLRNEVMLIDTQQGRKVYIPKDGYLTLARRTGELAGIETEVYRSEDDKRPRTSATAKVTRLQSFATEYDSKPCVYSAGGTVLDAEKRPAKYAAALAQTRALRRALSYGFSDVLPDPEADPDLDVVDEYEIVETQRDEAPEELSHVPSAEPSGASPPPAGDDVALPDEPAVAESGGGLPPEPPPDTPDYPPGHEPFDVPEDLFR